MGVNSLPRQRRDCDLNPGPSAPESSTLTTQLSLLITKDTFQQGVYKYSLTNFKEIAGDIQGTFFKFQKISTWQAVQHQCSRLPEDLLFLSFSWHLPGRDANPDLLSASISPERHVQSSQTFLYTLHIDITILHCDVYLGLKYPENYVFFRKQHHTLLDLSYQYHRFE